MEYTWEICMLDQMYTLQCTVHCTVGKKKSRSVYQVCGSKRQRIKCGLMKRTGVLYVYGKGEEYVLVSSVARGADSILATDASDFFFNLSGS